MSFASSMLKMMASGGKKIRDELEEKTKDPMRYQNQLLFSLLDKNKDTVLGRRLNFAGIRSAEDFQKKIPFTDYDFYAEEIGRMMDGKKDILSSDDIPHFNVTSGTLGVPKKIPVNERQISIFASYYARYVNYLIGKESGYGFTRGKGLNLNEGKFRILPSGASVGSASSLSSARMSRMIPFLHIDFMKSMYTSPVEARLPEPDTPTRYIHALFALREVNITYSTVTFSSYLLELMRYIEKNWRMLAETIRTGIIPEEVIADAGLRHRLEKKIKPSAERAAELVKVFEEGFETPVVPRIWPDFAAVITVGGAGFQIYTDKLRSRYLGSGIRILYLGLSASEGMISVPLECENENAVFVPDSVFLEFLPVDEDGHTGSPQDCLTLDRVEKGKCYELVITTQGGFVRYRMKDVVEITGFHNATPTMKFRSRTGYAISMYGEKTSEEALQYTVRKTAEELGLDVYDYAFCPDDDEVPGRYVLCLELVKGEKSIPEKEKIRAAAQKYLSEANPSIGEKMDKGTVKPLGLRILEEETFLLYRDLMILKGTAGAQLKPVHVLRTPFQKKFFYKLSKESDTE